MGVGKIGTVEKYKTFITVSVISISFQAIFQTIT